MVPHGEYTVTNSPTRYAYPAPSHDIRSSRGTVFALEMANLGGLRNFQCLVQTSRRARAICGSEWNEVSFADFPGMIK